MFTFTMNGAAAGEGWAIEEWQAAELACPPPEGAALELWLGGAALEPFLRPGDPAWRWRWPAQGAVGSHALLLRALWPDGRAAELRAELLVRPRKLDAERHRALLEDMQRLGRELLFALAGGAAGAAWPLGPDDSPASPAEELAGLLGPELDQFLAAAERIARRPPERLRPAIGRVLPGQARDLRRAADELARGGEPGDTRSPQEILGSMPSIAEARSAPSHDSYEARLLRRTLALLARRVDGLLASPGLPAAALGRGAAARGRLRELAALPAIAAAGDLAQFAGPSARMQRDPDQRAVYRMWQRLRRRPALAWDAATMAIPVQEIARLYERWCAARVALALLRLPGLRLESQALAAEDGADDGPGWALGLAAGGPLLTLAGRDGLRLRLRYQARYRPGGAPIGSLDRHTRVPDLALELERPDAPPQLLALDAKYRLDGSGGVPEDALADAYSYLGGLGRADGGRAALAVALLYPGRGPAEIYPSGVAALPLLPGDDAALEGWLARLLADALPPAEPA